MDHLVNPRHATPPGRETIVWCRDGNDFDPAHESGPLWLEITGRCQLICTHCYAASGPYGERGVMTVTDWCTVIEQAADLGFRRVTFIGGEPTLHHGLPTLVNYSLRNGLQVSIYSNFFRLRPTVWELAALPGVRLETSYYSDSADEHDAITGVRGSHSRTTSTIKEALRRGLAVHVALVSVIRDQRLDSAREVLQELGASISGTYRVRAIGRAARSGLIDNIDELCGRCGAHTLSINSNGLAYPCIFARQYVVGNVRTASLSEILLGNAMNRARRSVRESTWTAGPETGNFRLTDRCPP